MLERELEKIFVAEVKRSGGYAYKFTSPGNDGVPDRLVCLPGGYVVFVELKTETGKLSKLQKKQIEKLLALGQTVHVLYGLPDLDYFFTEYGMDESAIRIENRMKRQERSHEV